nr:serine/threonine-protein kinase HT1 [Ipomoea batatas]
MEAHGSKLPCSPQPPKILFFRWMAPMHVQNSREIPEHEIDPKELDFINSVDITKVKLTS